MVTTNAVARLNLIQKWKSHPKRSGIFVSRCGQTNGPSSDKLCSDYACAWKNSSRLQSLAATTLLLWWCGQFFAYHLPHCIDH